MPQCSWTSRKIPLLKPEDLMCRLQVISSYISKVTIYFVTVFFSLYATLRGHLRQLRYDVVHTDSRYQLTLDLKIGLQSSALYHRMSLFHKVLLPRKNVFCLYTQGMQVQSHNLNGMAGSNQGTQFVRALFREVTIEQLEFYHIPLVRKRLDGGK